jgi:hypothetical protein
VPVSAAYAAPSTHTRLTAPTPHDVGCTSPQVAVVVNFAHFGGSAERGCANYSASLTGTSLLHSAGFTTTGTADYPDTFICKINGEPDTSCANTPPASASWSYWHAAPGATSWTHSNVGAASAHPAAGSADAWNFGDTNTAPPFSPQSVLPALAVAAPTTTHPATAPTRPATSAPVHTAPITPDATSRSPTAPPLTSSPPTPTRGSPTDTTGSAKARPTTTRIPSSSASATGSVTIENVRPSAATGPKKDGSSPWPAIGGGLAVVVIAAGGGTVAWRRRRSE